MMLRLALILFSCVHVRVMSHETKVECHEFEVTEFHPSNGISPSVLADLKVVHVTEGGKDMLNISWAVNIDASVEYLTGTQILTGEASYNCEYKPHLSKEDKSGPTQKWFHYIIRASPGTYIIQATNLPLPPLGSSNSYRFEQISIPPTESTTAKTTTPGRDNESAGIGHVAVAMVGGLVVLMILTACYIIYKYRGNSIDKPLGFRSLPQTPVVPVPVLVVYPAENAAFQQAVVALSEFLQWHGGCRVAIDMWQQVKIAALGPMRWLAEQAKAADRVLIICPQHSQQPSHSPPDGSFPQPSIPAAAHDLYPLILNMVASHAKSPSDLAKFWVVQLGKQQDKRLCSELAVELRACRSFCLMKDLNKLCRSLHTQRQTNEKMSYLSSWAQVSYSMQSTVALQEAVEKIFRHTEPLRNVVTSV